MADETIFENETERSHRAIASYLHRVADAFDDRSLVPVDEDGTVTVTPPEEATFEVELEREEGLLELEFEVEWPKREGDIDADATASRASFELYEDAAGEWRWRLVHDNGNIIADGGEGYSSRQKARQGIDSVKRNARNAPVETQE